MRILISGTPCLAALPQQSNNIMILSRLITDTGMNTRLSTTHACHSLTLSPSRPAIPPRHASRHKTIINLFVPISLYFFLSLFIFLVRLPLYFIFSSHSVYRHSHLFPPTQPDRHCKSYVNLLLFHTAFRSARLN